MITKEEIEILDNGDQFSTNIFVCNHDLSYPDITDSNYKMFVYSTNFIAQSVDELLQKINEQMWHCPKCEHGIRRKEFSELLSMMQALAHKGVWILGDKDSRYKIEQI